jgi:hypothetical protein
MLYEPPTNITTSVDSFRWLNEVVDLWLFQGIVITVFGIMLISMLNNNNNSFAKAMASSSFVAMILAVLCRVLNFVPTWFMSLWIGITALSSIIMYVEDARE